MPVSHAALVKKLLMLVAGAFLFAFAMVPLYNVLCEATGFNGKTAGKKNGFVAGGIASDAQAAPSRIDRSRLVTVEFTGTVMPGLPWEMRPLTTSLETHPGEMQQVRYLVRNTSDQPITGQAVPSVTPGQAAQHFEKIECFCFNQQALGPGESREMPLVFVVKPDMDRDVRHITLSYAFFSIDGQRQTLTQSTAAPRETR
jgi:cytochrome c oxidase assembly protein subunit 11